MENCCNLSPAERTLLSWERRTCTDVTVYKLTAKQALQLKTFSITRYLLCEQIKFIGFISISKTMVLRSTK